MSGTTMHAAHERLCPETGRPCACAELCLRVLEREAARGAPSVADSMRSRPALQEEHARAALVRQAARTVERQRLQRLAEAANAERAAQERRARVLRQATAARGEVAT